MRDDQTRARFIKHLLSDIKALETMINDNLIENDTIRIGAEQEFCLVTDQWRPSKHAQDVLKAINDPHFTTELARYNLEINLDPIELKSACFAQMQSSLKSLLAKAQNVAQKYNNNVVLAGILPTIGKKELGFDYMTPSPRYRNLNEIARELRGGDFELNLSGVDELTIRHDSVLFEACNTSFQMHLQITSDDFISSYNWAQAISGPVLSVCTNSPLLLGRELWSETRIALFQQSIDTRGSTRALRDRQARVTIGNHWAEGSAVDIFKNDAALYNVILTKDITKDSMEELGKGNIPKLEALCLHNGTIYRWNRACYGVGNGKPHLRIENRYIPSGPTVLDQMANFAFWIGLMKGRPSQYDHMASKMDFRDAKANFINAARTGKDSALHWNGDQVPVPKLITNELLPMAYSGLEKEGIDKQDIEKLLGIIAQRAEGQTASKWLIKNYRNLSKEMKKDDALLTVTKALHHNQKIEDQPVHLWPMLKAENKAKSTAHLVSHIMSTRLYIVNDSDLARLATNVMEWKNIHHVPVENQEGDLCGLLTWTHLERYKKMEEEVDYLEVADIMTKDVVTVHPDTEISKAIELMKKLEYGCMPVVQGKELVGIITIKDVIPFDHD
ncbi:MAG: CBS domain-containing protein [Reichenbachiella sp.]|uniref:CBS domain-containing protein n=1 Tax=Reichenbachiella sp. TaxID=2184521 RepID=UPI003266C200